MRGADSELALAMTEVFRGNKLNCMKVTPFQIRRMFEMLLESDEPSPEVLDMLRSLINVCL